MVNILVGASTYYWSGVNAPQGNWPAEDEMGVFQTFVNSADERGASIFQVFKDSALTQPIMLNLHAVDAFFKS